MRMLSLERENRNIRLHEMVWFSFGQNEAQLCCNIRCLESERIERGRGT